MGRKCITEGKVREAYTIRLLPETIDAIQQLGIQRIEIAQLIDKSVKNNCKKCTK